MLTFNLRIYKNISFHIFNFIYSSTDQSSLQPLTGYDYHAGYRIKIKLICRLTKGRDQKFIYYSRRGKFLLNENINIEFVSSSHKLKQFTELKIDDREHCADTTENKPKFNADYKRHKKDGVYYCSLMLNANNNLNKWIDSLNTKKKDDLADSFLQGIWYLKHKNI